MITVYNPSNDPFYNQAFEEFVFTNFLQDDIFFLWQNAPSVIVGCSQNICREVRIQKLRELQIPVVRRMTGGGTVYHDLGNVNYTYITSQPEFDFNKILAPVVAALNAVGVPCRRGHTSELMIENLKISGSAQHISKGRVLHHGTLLFECDLDRLNSLTAKDKNTYFSGGVSSNVCAVTNIRPYLRQDLSMLQFCEKLLKQFNTRRVDLTGEQLYAVEQLRDQKYKTWEWTWGRTPAFHYNRCGEFAGSPIRVEYRVKGGMVTDGVIEQSGICCDIHGLRFDPDVFFQLCMSLAGNRASELFDFLM